MERNQDRELFGGSYQTVTRTVSRQGRRVTSMTQPRIIKFCWNFRQYLS